LGEDAYCLTKAYKLFLIKESNVLMKYVFWCEWTLNVPGM